ncbi:hypothetical protein D3C80_1518190 [compost metagenome]
MGLVLQVGALHQLVQLNLVDQDHSAPCLARRQGDVEGFDADTPARGPNLTAGQIEEFLVQSEAQVEIGQGGEGL